MRTVFLTELVLSPKYNLQQTIIGLIVSVSIAIGMSNIYCIVPILAVSITFSRAFTWVALDEQNGWEGYRAALPITRAEIMLGRMLAILFMLLVVVIVGIVLQAIMSAMGPVIATIFTEVDLEGYGFDASYIALVACASILITVFLIAFTIPLAARFGMTRAIRYIPLCFAVVIILGIVFAGMMPSEEFVSGLGFLAGSNLLQLSIALILLSAALYAATTFVSVLLYRKRQF